MYVSIVTVLVVQQMITVVRRHSQLSQAIAVMVYQALLSWLMICRYQHPWRRFVCCYSCCAYVVKCGNIYCQKGEWIAWVLKEALEFLSASLWSCNSYQDLHFKSYMKGEYIWNVDVNIMNVIYWHSFYIEFNTHVTVLAWMLIDSPNIFPFLGFIIHKHWNTLKSNLYFHWLDCVIAVYISPVL